MNKTSFTILLAGILIAPALSAPRAVNQSLIQAMRELVKKAGKQNFVIITDNEDRMLKVYSFDREPSPRSAPNKSTIVLNGTGLTQQELIALHERQRQEIKLMNRPDEMVIPPISGQPGLTRGELQALHERHH